MSSNTFPSQLPLEIGSLGSPTINDLTATGFTSLYDNIIKINSDEIGDGVTKAGGLAGIQINRSDSGTVPHFQLLFDESDDLFKVGFEGVLEPVSLRELLPTDCQVAVWDDTNKIFSTTKSANFLSLISGTGFTTTLYTVADLTNNILILPPDSGSFGTFLTTDGIGNLSWGTPGPGGPSISLTNLTDVTLVGSANRDVLMYDDTTFLWENNTLIKDDVGLDQVDNMGVVDILNNTVLTGTTILNGSYVSGIRNDSTLAPIILVDDGWIQFTNTGNVVVTLPPIATNTGRHFIFTKASAIGDVTIFPAVGDIIDDGTYPSIKLTALNERTKIASNGINGWVIL